MVLSVYIQQSLCLQNQHLICLYKIKIVKCLRGAELLTDVQLTGSSSPVSSDPVLPDPPSLTS